MRLKRLAAYKHNLSKMLAKPRIIIAAIASRAYVHAAVKAGFEVIAIDAFCDMDTQAQALQVWQVPARNGGFDLADFKSTLAKVDYTDVLGMTIGAGFEAQPELLASIASAAITPIFNAPNMISAVKNPDSFFGFLASINAPYPATQLAKPKTSIGWLQKQVGGSGGAHIKPTLPLNLAEKSPVYYQQKCLGEPHGCLFLADGKQAQIIGVHQQWCAPTETQPYRFGGAVSHAEIAQDIAVKIDGYVQAITQHFGLRGVNSLDFMLHNKNIYLLEINPRLSASLQLYAANKGDLFAAHVQACLGELKVWPVIEKQSQAMHIVYANKTAQVPPNMPWPDWVRDIPRPNSEIAAGAPICTILASARTAKLARKKVLQRANDL